MTITKYIWDEDYYIAEADGNDVVNVVYTSEPHVSGGLISARLSGTSSYHHFDGIDSTRQLTNAAGTVTDTWIHSAWGTDVARTVTTAAHLTWLGSLGYYSDSETSEIYVRRRMYVPAVARWLSTDELMSEVLRRYVYCLNSPIFLVDPSGQFSIPPGAAPIGLTLPGPVTQSPPNPPTLELPPPPSAPPSPPVVCMGFCFHVEDAAITKDSCIATNIKASALCPKIDSAFVCKEITAKLTPPGTGIDWLTCPDDKNCKCDDKNKTFKKKGAKEKFEVKGFVYKKLTCTVTFDIEIDLTFNNDKSWTELCIKR